MSIAGFQMFRINLVPSICQAVTARCKPKNINDKHVHTSIYVVYYSIYLVYASCFEKVVNLVYTWYVQGLHDFQCHIPCIYLVYYASFKTYICNVPAVIYMMTWYIMTSLRYHDIPGHIYMIPLPLLGLAGPRTPGRPCQ